MATETLDIYGYRNVPVPNTFFKQDGNTHHLAIVFPGMGYTCHKPLLYYPTLLLKAMGADVLWVEYDYRQNPEFQSLSGSGRDNWLFADADAACQAALTQRPYERVTLVGKSLGTLAMGHLLTSEPALRKAEAVWLTPLLWNEVWREQVREYGGRSLFVCGTADPHYNAEHLNEVATVTAGRVVVVEDANHSLEITNDVFRSLEAIEQVLHALQVLLA